MPRDLLNDYEIPQHHLEMLQALCGNQQYASQDLLPEPVRRQYISDRVRADKIGISLGPSELWNIVCRSGAVHSIPDAIPKTATLYDQFKAGQIKIGAYVMCAWRNTVAHEIPGELLGFHKVAPGAYKPQVRFLGDAEERILSPAAVVLAPEGWEPTSNKSDYRKDDKRKPGRPRKEPEPEPQEA